MGVAEIIIGICAGIVAILAGIKKLKLKHFKSKCCGIGIEIDEVFQEGGTENTDE